MRVCVCVCVCVVCFFFYDVVAGGSCVGAAGMFIIDIDVVDDGVDIDGVDIDVYCDITGEFECIDGVVVCYDDGGITGVNAAGGDDAVVSVVGVVIRGVGVVVSIVVVVVWL